MEKTKEQYQYLSRFYKVGYYIILVGIVLTFLFTYYMRKDTINRMNYSYQNLMTEFPELSSIDLAIGNTFNSLDTKTLQLEMYQSYFRGTIFALASDEEITQERLADYYMKVSSNPEDGWNKEITKVLDTSIDLININQNRYAKEYSFEVQRSFAIDIPAGLYVYFVQMLLGVVAGILLFLKVLSKVVSFFSQKIKRKTNDCNKLSEKEKHSFEKNVHWKLMWGLATILTVCLLSQIVLTISNVHKKEFSEVLTAIKQTVNELPQEQAVLFDSDKAEYFEKYRDSYWYVNRVGFELADYLLYNYKTTGDDSFLTKYYANLNDVDKETSNRIKEYISKSKENIEQFVPDFSSLDSTMMTETMYISILNPAMFSLTSDWYMLEILLPTILIYYFLVIVCIVLFTYSYINKMRYKILLNR